MLVVSSCCGCCFEGGGSVALVVFVFWWRFIILRKFIHGVRVLLDDRILDVPRLLVEIAQDLTAFPSLFYTIGVCFLEG